MKIIILDDSMTVRIILESYLEDLGIDDDEMFSFENGNDAVKFIEENGADIIFSDINMPIMNGFEFARIIFAQLPELKKRFFAISGDESRESYLKMKQYGVHHFLKKPINSAHFKHFILPIITKQRNQQP